MDNDNFRYVLDALNAKHERTEKRLFVIIVALIVAIILSTAVFVWYISLPAEDVTIENSDGNANYIGNDMNGDFNYGENQSEKTGD